MASIPYSSGHSVGNLKEIQNLFENPLVAVVPPSPSPSLQYFNIRVTERLHRYRSLRRQWQEIATTIPSDPTWTPKCSSPQTTTTENSHQPPPPQSPSIELKIFTMNESTNPTTTFRENIDKTPADNDPLHSRIQQDLIQLRRLIKARQKKLSENQKAKVSTNNVRPSHESVPTATVVYDQQENMPTYLNRECYHINRMKSSQSGRNLSNVARPFTFPHINFPDNSIPAARNSSSIPSREPRSNLKSSQFNPTIQIYRNQMNLGFTFDPTIELSPYTKKKSLLPSKSNATTISVKTTRAFRLPFQTTIKKKPFYSLPRTSVAQIPTTIEPTTQRSYTYAASSSAFTPSSMKLTRNTSLLPILLTSITCVGVQSSTNRKDDDPDYHHWKNYQQLINDLPQPIISIVPRQGQDDYAIILEQLDHIRSSMPDDNVYDDFTRNH